MISGDLKQVLEEVYRAGAHRVPADDIDWPQELHAAVFRALNMQYITRREIEGVVRFSLTQAGYRAIGVDVPWGRILRQRMRDLLRMGAVRG